MIFRLVYWRRLFARRGALFFMAMATLAMGFSLSAGLRYLDQSALSIFYGAALAFLVAAVGSILMFNQVRISRAHYRIRRRENQLGQLLIREQALLDSMPGFAWISNNAGDILSANPTFAELFGAAPKAGHFLPSEAADADVIAHHEAIQQRATTTYDLSLDKTDGDQQHYRVIKTAGGANGDWVASVAVDITDLVRAQESNRFLAEHDSLTGLANRATLLKRLPAYLADAKDAGRGLAILFIDLDGFKLVNDSLGHEAGDKLLVEVARRLKVTAGAHDLISRHGGDEFVIVSCNATSDTTADFSRQLLDVLATPLVISGRQISISASIGVALYPGDASDATHLLKCADMAMYQAKRSGKNRFVFYIAEDKSISGRARISIDLRQAIHRSELSLRFQPQYDLQSRLMVGVESLISWNHPELGMIPPSQFISVAEESDLILDIGRWVLNHACEQGQHWLRLGITPFTIAVNISPRHLRTGRLFDDVIASLEATGFPPHLLELEITEGVLIDVSSESLGDIERLRKYGVNIAIDDFGVGYSSLDYLARLPIDKVKLDQSLVANITEHGKHAAITKAVISLCKSLGMTVLAEGVESAWHVGFLAANGCDEGQGYFFSRPITPDELAKLLVPLPHSVKDKVMTPERDAPQRPGYSRFIPSQMLQILGVTNLDDIQLGANVEKEVTLFFSDIRDFTAMSNTMIPGDVFRFLNSYLSMMEPVIERNHGVTDKYIGDAIMGIFPRTADDAVRAGINLLRRLSVYNEGRIRAGFIPIRIGIGINTGIAFLGTIGGHGRMDTTVVGDAVNLASRIEGLTKRYGVPMLIGEDARSALADPTIYQMRLVDRASIRGQAHPQLLYEVYDADPEETRNAKSEIDACLQEGIALYHLNELDGALQRFVACHDRLPSDGVVNAYMDECRGRIGGEAYLSQPAAMMGNVGLLDPDVQACQTRLIALLDSLSAVTPADSEWLDRIQAVAETFAQYRAAETLLMERYRYPFAQCHGNQHGALSQRLNALITNRASLSPAHLGFSVLVLVDCFLNHIAKADRHLGHFVRRAVAQPTTMKILARR